MALCLSLFSLKTPPQTFDWAPNATPKLLRCKKQVKQNKRAKNQIRDYLFYFYFLYFL